MPDQLLWHATAVAIDGEGVLLRGPPGSGKSDLALRLIDAGARLVADDQSLLRRDNDRVVVAAPAPLAGLIEVRGLGILRVETVAQAPLFLIADLVPPEQVERFPERSVESVLGLAVPCLRLAPFEASAAAKLRFARHAFAAAGPHAILGG